MSKPMPIRRSPFAACTHGAEPECGVDGDVLVQPVHELPALLLAHELEPAGDRQIAGAGRGRVRHHHLALVLGLGEVGPARRLRRFLFLLGLGGVEADDAEEGVHADPGVGVLAAPEDRLQRRRALGRVGLEHAHAFSNSSRARGGEAQTLSARGLSFSARKRAVMTPVESRTQTISMSGIVGLEGLLERLELVVLDRTQPPPVITHKKRR